MIVPSQRSCFAFAIVSSANTVVASGKASTDVNNKTSNFFTIRPPQTGSICDVWTNGPGPENNKLHPNCEPLSSRSVTTLLARVGEPVIFGTAPVRTIQYKTFNTRRSIQNVQYKTW